MVVGLEGCCRRLHDVGEAREHCLVERLGDKSTRHMRCRSDSLLKALVCGGRNARSAERKLRHVEDLHRKAATDLHLTLVKRRIRAEASRGCPVANSVGAMRLKEAHGGDDIALGLRHLLAVRIEDPAGDCRVLPRQRAVLKV